MGDRSSERVEKPTRSEPCTAYVQAFATGFGVELGIHCPECQWSGGYVATITSHYLSILQGRHDKQARHEAAKRERQRVREAAAALQSAYQEAKR